MRIIVDANIIFSAILNTDGKIGDVLLNSQNIFDFVAPRFLKDEIKKYHEKI
jgi:predicted nucleic acid-binding protein